MRVAQYHSSASRPARPRVSASQLERGAQAEEIAQIERELTTLQREDFPHSQPPQLPSPTRSTSESSSRDDVRSPSQVSGSSSVPLATLHRSGRNTTPDTRPNRKTQPTATTTAERRHPPVGTRVRVGVVTDSAWLRVSAQEVPDRLAVQSGDQVPGESCRQARVRWNDMREPA